MGVRTIWILADLAHFTIWADAHNKIITCWGLVLNEVIFAGVCNDTISFCLARN
jgi:hypothetical protein